MSSLNVCLIKRKNYVSWSKCTSRDDQLKRSQSENPQTFQDEWSKMSGKKIIVLILVMFPGFVLYCTQSSEKQVNTPNKLSLFVLV